MTEAGTAIETLLDGLIDYAGMYPPASLDLHSAVENYREYGRGKHAHALGRLIVDVSKVEELRASVGGLENLKLSVIISESVAPDALCRLIDQGVPIEAVEARAARPDQVERIVRMAPSTLETYVEVPVESIQPDLLRAVSDAGARLKLRMGGVSPEAFPSAAAVARAVESAVRAGVPFKATAGLHHPIRSFHRLTYAKDSPTGAMHGFINLIGAVAFVHCGANAAEAERVLDDQDPNAWSLTPQTLAWRSSSWTADTLSKIREKFVSFGSCSFEEPIRDLEAMGWL